MNVLAHNILLLEPTRLKYVPQTLKGIVMGLVAAVGLVLGVRKGEHPWRAYIRGINWVTMKVSGMHHYRAASIAS